jgi:hypothetical protein
VALGSERAQRGDGVDVDVDALVEYLQVEVIGVDQAAAWSTPPPMSLRRPTRPMQQPPTSSPPNRRRASQQTASGVSAEGPPNARFQSVIQTEEVHHDERNRICSQ